jgi:hypothetical protein
MRSVTHLRTYRRAFSSLGTSPAVGSAPHVLGSAGYTVIRAQIYQDYQTYALYQALLRAGPELLPRPAPALSLSPRLIRALRSGNSEIPRLPLVGDDPRRDRTTAHCAWAWVTSTIRLRFRNPGNVGIAGHRDTFFQSAAWVFARMI